MTSAELLCSPSAAALVGAAAEVVLVGAVFDVPRRSQRGPRQRLRRQPSLQFVAFDLSPVLWMYEVDVWPQLVDELAAEESAYIRSRQRADRSGGGRQLTPRAATEARCRRGTTDRPVTTAIAKAIRASS